MRSEFRKQRQARRSQSGNTILEFALVMTFLVPMFAGAFTIGMALTKAIQVSNVARDAVVLMVRSNSDPESGLDLAVTQNQRIIVRAAQGLGMNSDAQDDPSSTGSAVCDSVQSRDGGPDGVFLGRLDSQGYSAVLGHQQLPELWQLRI